MANRDYIMMTRIKIKLEEFLAEKSICTIRLYCVKCNDATKPDVRAYLGCGVVLICFFPILSFLNRKVWHLKWYWNKYQSSVNCVNSTECMDTNVSCLKQRVCLSPFPRFKKIAGSANKIWFSALTVYASPFTLTSVPKLGYSLCL